ncbi:FAD-dependent oxidoreductase [Bacillus sp. KH172YL63]|uniref:FAD-dependent oxidoreductase n=1 Tax=Bacillus sp. KH172YL63 TaxID=2709784 RepID=UPI0013E520F0|nr:FAD-dependent oxidoreductase [Bacillus sp. KH172YL63]BCB04160.1 hypothetical protein KH172YL63_22930 [Bacillus sp. KH172YL63]
MKKKIVIVGGVAGGATAAARLRRLSEEDEIVLVEKGEYISFANCGLPYYIGEVITNRDALLVQTVEGMSRKFNLDIRNLSEVVEINRDRNTVSIKKVATGEIYEDSYDKLILSPGARPIVPPLAGLSEAENVFTLRNVPDTDRIKAWVDEKSPKDAVIIGGGFIGLEMAENLHHRGVNVTVVELGDQVMAPIDYEMASLVHRELRSEGVELYLNDGVKEFKHDGRTIVLQSGREITSDLTILSIGVRPENELAQKAGLSLGDRGGIVVNSHLQTDDPDIYAIGDAIEVKDFVQGTPAMIPLAWPANRQGRLAADHINGKDAAYNGSLGTSVAKVFDLTVAATGNNEKVLKRLEFIPMKRSCISRPASNAAYRWKLQMVNPVNMAGYVAGNVVDGDLSIVHHHEIDEIVKKGGYLIDVREPEEVEAGFITGAVNIPLGELRERLQELPNQHIYVNCQVGLRGYLATKILTNNGFEASNLSGGYKTYMLGK